MRLHRVLLLALVALASCAPEPPLEWASPSPECPKAKVEACDVANKQCYEERCKRTIGTFHPPLGCFESCRSQVRQCYARCG